MRGGSTWSGMCILVAMAREVRVWRVEVTREKAG